MQPGTGVVRLAAAVAVLMALGRPAPAADDEEEAAVRARAASLQAEGHRLLTAGDADGALERFLAAYRLVPSPKVLFNMGSAYEKVGDAASAYECFDRFLAEARDVPPDSRATAERSRAAMRARVALVELVAPTGADLVVDGRAMGRTPLSRPLVLAPGTRVFRLERDGRPLSEKAVPVPAGVVTRFVIDVAAGAASLPPTLRAGDPASAPRAALVARALATPADPPRPAIYRRWWFWTGIAVAAAAVGAVVAAGALAPRDARCPSHWQCPGP